ncbi:hypothetical protein ACPB8Q_00135 [Methanocaldococcus indicus]|uniref:hypothetical protein n=1 Tax=Methanocaldococcus indicus TaxID=213231 RepID=UPI003C6D6342
MEIYKIFLINVLFFLLLTNYASNINNISGKINIINLPPENISIKLLDSSGNSVSALSPTNTYTLEISVSDLNGLKDIKNITVDFYYLSIYYYPTYTVWVNSSISSSEHIRFIYIPKNDTIIKYFGDNNDIAKWNVSLIQKPDYNKITGTWKFNFTIGSIAASTGGFPGSVSMWKFNVTVSDENTTVIYEDPNNYTMNSYVGIILNCSYINYGNVKLNNSSENNLSITTIYNTVSWNVELKTDSYWSNGLYNISVVNVPPGTNEMAILAENLNNKNWIYLTNNYNVVYSYYNPSDSNRYMTLNIPTKVVLGTNILPGIYEGKIYIAIIDT